MASHVGERSLRTKNVAVLLSGDSKQICFLCFLFLFLFFSYVSDSLPSTVR